MMGYNFDTLKPLVRSILSAPSTDLSTISAKRVRRELIGREAKLTQDFVKENKEEINKVITRVFAEVNEACNGEVSAYSGEPVTASRPQSSSDPGEAEEYEQEDGKSEAGEEAEAEEEEKPQKAKKGSKKGLSDAELARQLSSEINGRSRRSSGKGRAANSTPKKNKAKKSATTIDSDGAESGEGGGKKTKKKKRTGEGGAKGGFAKEYTLSAPLASLLQVDKLSRPQVVKQLWNYIKANERQNPSNKREILCDNNLRAVFSVDKIDMFKMNKVLGQHLHED
ncbi:hypothetical protein D9757_006126 [Collybiopsis confluens]|uniref:DM2 domain-containing protein n=1 Tax=Collybiopsis confluens TaxID=2823264 RepID=A0A8H5HHS7_9AGAR|nr:hypothetical protein D9757_006126 [Collybiopsis confluens]